ncbi:type II toxin-antitoxin system Phd/YefM family antitoxin [Staphylococcus arlettae]|uniref:type II toxin-antitoxin system Phd/YefM family antitoxin n=1 Tax=Staphylococcus TaxID=1279 RepID=UPI001AEC217F|nr:MULTISPECIES: type II toxin-antitoxin system Phd/YefM family antitoxin [Staphylococcus]MEB6038123.1 type II toxin-antitoxin system Phd/YefM family antitoxin [Staphylococcus pseudoxylosus]MEB6062115.1 type II toxin-antitoxin system Phd/YefM family antitoxin [Staphylococcus pseudoxylosus]MEB7422909.1 type II toxin-antitoxin system Phd/YefM family antitoxin [Staphylococcus arlettae]MEB7765376.1 type II toxin-antitoxin system Phd/YefM family antitoxin [Staphylococcus pseudoxylosus]MEB8086033.1 
MNIKTPTNARKEFYELLKQVNDSHEPVIISGSKSENNAVIIGQKDWNSIQETLYLESTGTMDKVREREKDNSGYTDIDELDWDTI